MRERFHLDAPGWFAREEPVPHLAALARAVWDEQRVELRYWKRDGEVRRLADPLGLVLKAGVWYLVALSGRTRSVRTFRVSRVLSVRSLQEPALRPEGFDLAVQWTKSSVAFFETWPSVAVRVRVRADRRSYLRDILEPGAAAEALAEAPQVDDDGWCEVTVRMESLAMAQHELLRFGGELEVLEPVELREAIALTAAAMVERYAASPA
jgi:predicted DNA-binding transcriptional regulator YafY